MVGRWVQAHFGEYRNPMIKSTPKTNIPKELEKIMKSLSTLLRITVFLFLILSGCTFPGQPPPLEPSSIPQAIIEQTQIVTNSSALTKTEVMTTLQPSLEKSTTPTLYKTVSPQKNTALINTKVSVTPQLSPENTISPTSTKMATLQPTSEVLIPTCLEQG